MDEYKPRYRADIDGLRAVAVGMVVTFHLFDGLLSAGFLGVDVFFVISGYLITTILYRECQQGHFSLLTFYDRRIRRIIPALVFMLVAVTIIACVLLLSFDLKNYGGSVIAALAFYSNIYFWRTINYFNPVARTMPLLHTWSLSVEEQFYIVFPLLLWFLYRRGGQWLVFWTVIALSVASFALGVVVIQINRPLTGFYLLPMRAWELGLGAMLAVGNFAPSFGRRLRTAIALLGAALLAISMIVLDPALWSPLPPATFACIGTTLLIWTGRGPNPVARALSFGPVVYIGRISYSLYLWHWPIYVFAAYYLIRQPTWLESCGLVALSIAMAAFSLRFIERPFRGHAMPRRRVFAAAGAAVALCVAGGAGLVAARGLPERFSPQAAVFNRLIGSSYRCSATSYRRTHGVFGCAGGLPGGDPDRADVVLLGNSHAQMYAPALAPALRARGLTGFMIPINSCDPIAAFNLSAECAAGMRANIEAAAGMPARIVVLAFVWHGGPTPMIDAAGKSIGNVGWPVYRRGLEQTIERLRRAGKTVILVGPIPTPGYDMASVVGREIAFYGEIRSPLGMSGTVYRRQFGAQEAWMRTTPDIVPVFPSSRFCDADWCSYLVGRQPVFTDSSHISQFAMSAFTPLFSAALDTALSADTTRLHP